MRFYGVPRGRGVSIALETGRPRPASSSESAAAAFRILIDPGEFEKVMGPFYENLVLVATTNGL